MPRQRNPLWDRVTLTAGYGTSGTKKWTCKYCGCTFAGGPIRIRAHLLRLRGYAIAICTQAPESLRIAGAAIGDESHASPSASGEYCLNFEL